MHMPEYKHTQEVQGYKHMEELQAYARSTSMQEVQEYAGITSMQVVQAYAGNQLKYAAGYKGGTDPKQILH
jgi:hypothetical protein